VDFGRRPYTTTARFFRNSPVEVKVKWYPADLTKGPLPFPSRISSHDWATEPHRTEGVGEVWNTDRDFNHAKNLGPIPGPHVCGTEDEFRNGEVFDPARPTMEYHASGIPKCCDDGRREGGGKVAPGGNQYTVRSDPYSSSGKVALLGRTHTVRSDPHTSSGGLFVVYVLHIVTSDPFHSSGGPKVIGATSGSGEPPYVSSGGPKVKGLALHIPRAPIVECETFECCPTMNGRCDATADSCIGCWCRFFQVGEFAIWRRYPTVPGNTYRFEISFDVESGGITWNFWQGDTCEGRTIIASGTERPYDQQITFVATGDFVWWDLGVPTTTGAVGYTRLLDIT